MKKKALFFAVISIFWVGLAFAAEPVVLFNVNQLPMTMISQGEAVELEIEIRPNDWTGAEAEYWLLYENPYADLGRFLVRHYDFETQSWQRGYYPSYQGSAYEIPPVLISTDGLPLGLVGAHVFWICIDPMPNGQIDESAICQKATLMVKQPDKSGVIHFWRDSQILALEVDPDGMVQNLVSNGTVCAVHTSQLEAGGLFCQKGGHFENLPFCLTEEAIFIPVSGTSSNDRENWFFNLCGGGVAWLNTDFVSGSGNRWYKMEDGLIEYGFYRQPVVRFELDGFDGATATIHFGGNQFYGFIDKIDAEKVISLRWNSFPNWEADYRAAVQISWLGDYFFQIHNLPTNDAGNFTLILSEGDPVWINLGAEWDFQAGSGLELLVDEITGIISYGPAS